MQRLTTLLLIMIFTCCQTIISGCQEGSKPSSGIQSTQQNFSDTIDISDKTVHETIDTTLKRDWPKRDTFTAEQLDTLRQSLVIANSIIYDTLFYPLIQNLADSNKVDWGSTRLSSIPRDHRSAPTAFLLDQFQRRHLNRLEDFQAYRWEDDSPTTGSVEACDTLPKVNVHKLDRGLRSIAGTMVHERVHSFCQKHISQNRDENECDLAYHVGTLTIALAAYRSNNSRSFTSRANMCSHLLKLLQQRNIIK